MQQQKLVVRSCALAAALAAACFVVPSELPACEINKADARVSGVPLDQAGLKYKIEKGVFTLMFDGPGEAVFFLDIPSKTEKTEKGEQRVLRVIVTGRYINFSESVKRKVLEAGKQLKEGCGDHAPSRHPLDNQFIFFAMKVPADADGVRY